MSYSDKDLARRAKNISTQEAPKGLLPDPSGAVGDGAAGALGKDGGSVGRSKWQTRRREVWALQRTAAQLLYPAGTPRNQVKGVGTCRWAVRSLDGGVDVKMNRYEETGQERASFSGLQTCGLVWSCPACAARISETRRAEMNELLSWARENSYPVRMITLTSRHGKEDDLGDMLDRMKRAKQAFHQRRDWKALKARGAVIGSVTATEVTHGDHGWHVHFHVLVIVMDARAAMVIASLGDAWRASLRGKGLDGNGAAFDIQNGDAAGRYIAKWGAAEELTLSNKKVGRHGGRSPLQLLADAKEGDVPSGKLWLQYEKCFRGRRQLVWSRGLKALVGIDEVDDQAAAEDVEQDGQEPEPPLASIDYNTWRDRGRWRRTDILDAAEADGESGVWRVLREEEVDDEVIEDSS